MKIPRACDTRQEIVTDARADFAECVRVQRRDDEDVSPLHQLQVQALLVEALCDLPLALIGENLGHRWNLIDVNKMLCTFGQHNSYLKKWVFSSVSDWKINEPWMMLSPESSDRVSWGDSGRRGVWWPRPSPYSRLICFSCAPFRRFSICPIMILGENCFCTERNFQFFRFSSRFSATILLQSHRKRL